MTLEKMREQLGMETVPGYFASLYAPMADSWYAHRDRILSDAFIEGTLSENFCLEPYRERILEAAAQLRENEALCLLVCLLEAWIAKKGDLSAVDGEAYIPPKGEGPAFDFLHLFPAIPTMAATVADFRNRGVPEDVIADTMGEYDYCVNFYAERTGRPGFDKGRLEWMCRVIRGSLIRIGRFKYDLPGYYMKGARIYRNGKGERLVLAENLWIHRSGRILGSVGHREPEGSFLAQILETEDTVTGHKTLDGLVETEATVLSKREWTLCLSDGDPVLRIHIPPDGSFDRKTVNASYARAREFFSRHYPDYPFKAFYCSTWLLSSDLRKILKPGSSILAFQEPYIPVPIRSSGTSVFSFAFLLPPSIPEDLHALPETTSLLRGVKQLYLDGGYIHEGAGVFF